MLKLHYEIFHKVKRTGTCFQSHTKSKFSLWCLYRPLKKGLIPAPVGGGLIPAYHCTSYSISNFLTRGSCKLYPIMNMWSERSLFEVFSWAWCSSANGSFRFSLGETEINFVSGYSTSSVLMIKTKCSGSNDLDTGHCSYLSYVIRFTAKHINPVSPIDRASFK